MLETPISSLFSGQHGASAVVRTAEAGVFFFQLGCFTHVDYQAVVVTEFLPGPDITQGFQENAVSVLIRLQIRFAGMINPSGGIALILGVDDVPVIQMKIECMIGLIDIVRVPIQRFLPRDNFSFVFQHCVAGLDR